MRSPFPPFYLLLFSLVPGGLFFYLQLIVVNEVAQKLGLTPTFALLLFASSLFGSTINLPLFTLHSQPPIHRPPQPFSGLLRLPTKSFAGKTVIAVNVGGCLMPIGFSLFLLNHNPIPLPALLIALSTVTAVSYGLSRPIPGIRYTGAGPTLDRGTEGASGGRSNGGTRSLYCGDSERVARRRFVSSQGHSRLRGFLRLDRWRWHIRRHLHDRHRGGSHCLMRAPNRKA